MLEESGAKDLIYNRFDIIFPGDYKTIEIDRCSIFFHKKDDLVYINIWGKYIAEESLEMAMEQYIGSSDEYLRFVVRNTRNNYKKVLIESQESILDLPIQSSELLERLTPKERYHLRWNIKHLNDYGEVSINHYNIVPINLVTKFFEWKKSTHERDYNMSEKEYIETYYVTHAMDLTIDGSPIAVLFYCKVEDTIYLENLSYDERYKKYSPGFTLYTEFLKEMVEQGSKTIYLGVSGLSYKDKFGARKCACYSGEIFSKKALKKLNEGLSDLGMFAVYGYGKLGHVVYSLLIQFGMRPQYIIEKNDLVITGINVYNPVLTKELPRVNKVIIAIKQKNVEVEEYLEINKLEYVYWEDFVAGQLKMNANN